MDASHSQMINKPASFCLLRIKPFFSLELGKQNSIKNELF